MKAAVCTELGEPPRIELVDRDIPEVIHNTAIVRTGAAGVNFGDKLELSGTYQFKKDVPFTVGSEVAGEIIDVGSGESNLSVGDRVMGFAETGAFAEYTRVRSDRVVRLPDAVSMREAAALFSNYGTAFCALSRRAGLRSGETLLVMGAGSGLGLAAVEIGRASGATVIAGCRSSAKREVALSHGAHHAVDHSSASMRDEIREITGGRGVDVVIDPIGGHSTFQALRSLAAFGRLVILGFASGTIPDIPANRLLLKNCSALGMFWGAYWEEDSAAQIRAFDQIFDWHAGKQISPYIPRVFALEDTAAALCLSASGNVTGKIVIEIGGTR